MKRDLVLAPYPITLASLMRSPAVLACLAAIVAIVAIYGSTAASIVAIWIRSETFTHGFIVVPLCLWLAWRRRDALARVPIAPYWPGLALIAVSGVLTLLASAAGALGIRQLAFAFIIQSAIVTVIGVKAARVLVFPLAFLLFAIPFGEFLVPILVDWTASFTVSALRLSGVPVYREGNFFVLPNGAWSVVDACSGIRYLIASIMIGTMYSVLTYRSRRKRLMFMAAAVVVPIAANWMRAYLIVMLGYLSNNRLAAGVDHIIYGWIWFGVVMLILFFIGSRWQENVAVDAAAAKLSLPTMADVPPARAPAPRFVAAALATVLVAAFFQPLEAFVHRGTRQGTPTLQRPVATDGWQVSNVQLANWTPRFVGSAAEFAQTYVRDGESVGLFVAYYRDQRRGQQLVSSVNALVPERGAWKVLARSDDRLSWNGRELDVDHARLTEHDTMLEAITLYWVGGRVTGSAYVAKLLQGWNVLVGDGDDGAVIVIYAAAGDRKDARTALQAFSASMSPAIDGMLAQARSGP